MKLPYSKGAVREVWMSPQDNLSDMACHHFGDAKSDIFIASFTPLGTAVLNALSQAHQRGVKVYAILDNAPPGRNRLDYPFKHKRVNIDNGSMHQKFAVLDDKTVLTGSWNFNGSTHCHNTLLLLSGPSTVKSFSTEARRLRRLPQAPTPKLFGKDAALNLIAQAVAKKGPNSFLDAVAYRVERRGWLTAREEAALHRTLA